MQVVPHRLEESRATETRRSPAIVRAPLRLASNRRATDHDYSREVAGAVARVARTYRLSPTETEDLRSDVWVKLLEHDARALRKFAGHAPIGTYLVSVAKNLLLDQRNKEWGKWRPSKAAHRAGPLGIALDRLLTRDGWPLHLAEASLRAAGLVPDGISVTSIASTLPTRVKRTFVDVHVLESAASPAPDPSEAAARRERGHDERRVAAALADAVRKLSYFERQLLVWRFVDGMTIAAIGPRVRVEARVLYRRFDKLTRRLRIELEAAGIDATMVRAALMEPSPGLSGQLAMKASLPHPFRGCDGDERRAVADA